MESIILEATVASLLNSLKLKSPAAIAVGCSGGPDSMALTLLAQRWAVQNKARLIALTVDHGLRPGSAAEARTVGRWLKKYGIAHAVLRWEGDKPHSNLQEAARQARYRLMAQYCAAHAIAHVLVAHTLEDQAETFLLRLARGSGVDGLSAMAPRTELYGITLLRPLLETPRQALVYYLQKHRQAFVSDPSNENVAFNRIKMRKALPQLDRLGLTVERLAATARAMGRAREALEAQMRETLAQTCVMYAEGYAVFTPEIAREEIGLRALASILMQVGGQQVRPRLHDLERLYAALKQEGFRGATLGGCEWIKHKKHFLAMREPGSVAPPLTLKAGETALWDRRFEVTVKKGRGHYVVGALAQKGWLAFAGKKQRSHPYPHKKILYSLPALWDSTGRLLAIPHLGVGRQWLDASFRWHDMI